MPLRQHIHRALVAQPFCSGWCQAGAICSCPGDQPDWRAWPTQPSAGTAAGALGQRIRGEIPASTLEEETSCVDALLGRPLRHLAQRPDLQPEVLERRLAHACGLLQHTDQESRDREQAGNPEECWSALRIPALDGVGSEHKVLDVAAQGLARRIGASQPSGRHLLRHERLGNHLHLPGYGRRAGGRLQHTDEAVGDAGEQRTVMAELLLLHGVEPAMALHGERAMIPGGLQAARLRQPRQRGLGGRGGGGPEAHGGCIGRGGGRWDAEAEAKGAEHTCQRIGRLDRDSRRVQALHHRRCVLRQCRRKGSQPLERIFADENGAVARRAAAFPCLPAGAGGTAAQVRHQHTQQSLVFRLP
mmetsp:Transcript_1989/g.7607  ORF Transcript_1989/g.7607 Transcript_1989/m.7607 type:complete len:359 (-) Transcript_1989:11336-12412(-)